MVVMQGLLLSLTEAFFAFENPLQYLVIASKVWSSKGISSAMKKHYTIISFRGVEFDRLIYVQFKNYTVYCFINP